LILQPHTRLSERAAEILGKRFEDARNGFIFPTDDGAAAIAQIHKTHRKTIDRLGFEFRLYDCRHTFATRALEGGVDLLTLASMLGHSGLGEVSRYAHPSEERKS